MKQPTCFRLSKDGITVVIIGNDGSFTAEDTAMLMSLHSRSPAGIEDHLKKLERSGSGSLMSNFYVGYGHKSIGDCGNTAIFVEGISMLAAKAIQDSPLYNGQECSTRYIDFSKQQFFDPIKSNESQDHLNALRNFYVSSFPEVLRHLEAKHPFDGSEDNTVYKKALNARAFDILRGFLPAGATTNVAWNTTLRNAADRLVTLRNHPLQEVRSIAEILQDLLKTVHEHSFSHKIYEGTEGFVSGYMDESYYHTSNNSNSDRAVILHNGVDVSELAKFEKILKSRPAKAEIPRFVGITGTLRVGFNLDFGSYRDLQRHRPVVMRMPLLSVRPGFEKWYLDQLPDQVKVEALKLIASVEKFCLSVKDDKTSQYYIPMGYKVPVEFSGDLPSIVYQTELRATKFVHPTLQRRAIEISDRLEELFGKYGLVLQVNRNDVGRFDIRRGQQDIVKIK